MSQSTLAYKKYLGRPALSRLLLEAEKRNSLKLLKKLSQYHLSKGNKQLVVFRMI